ncbi:unnamed protein product [Acanthoscelides obtectus]|nr:unnamed protein product [Acanthoscelides obtectus]CAK1621219.1 Sterol O-acyltransferase 1 [Acanthoscelides obtectus]
MKCETVINGEASKDHEEKIIKNGNSHRKAVHLFEFPEKKFEIRNSLLTDMIESNPHIKTIYNIFVALLIALFINTIAHDYLRTNEIKFGFHIISKAFGKLYISLITWLGYMTSTFGIFFLFQFWAKIRLNLSPKSKVIRLWDKFWLICLACYYITSFRVASKIVSSYKLPPASAAIIAIEQVRLLMKVHSFVRTKAEAFVKYKLHSEQVVPKVEFMKFLYFLFAPTLIYKDEYPRTNKIRWDFVFYRALDIVGIIFLYSFVFYRFVFPFFDEFGQRKYTRAEILAFMFDITFPSVLLDLATFYLMLHAVQNLFAELLRFGDRMFYKDWWRSTTYQQYYKTWNVIVYDWLRSYIFKDLYYLTNGNTTVAKLTVFVVSAIVHEWILTYMLGFFLPFLALQFGTMGLLLYFVNVPQVTFLNILFWYGNALGHTMNLAIYALEFNARLVYPSDGSWRDYLVPKFVSCDCIV